MEGTSGGQLVLLKQDHLEPFAQDHVQVAFEGLWGGRLHKLWATLFSHQHSEEVLPDVQREPSVSTTKWTPSPSLTGSFPAGWPPVHTGGWGCSSQVQGLAFHDFAISPPLQHVQIPLDGSTTLLCYLQTYWGYGYALPSLK